MFFHAIYSNELQLKSEHRGLHSTLLDIDITVVYGIFQCELHNKGDNYPFLIFLSMFFMGQFYLNL